MKHKTNTALDERGIGVIEIYTHNSMDDSAIEVSDVDNSTSLSARNKDNELEDIFEEISTDELTHGGQI